MKVLLYTVFKELATDLFVARRPMHRSTHRPALLDLDGISLKSRQERTEKSNGLFRNLRSLKAEQYSVNAQTFAPPAPTAARVVARCLMYASTLGGSLLAIHRGITIEVIDRLLGAKWSVVDLGCTSSRSREQSDDMYSLERR